MRQLPNPGIEERLQRGELLERSRVTFIMTSVLLAVRNHLLSLASRITRQLLPHVADSTGDANFQAIYQIVKDQVRAALTEASEFKAQDILNRKREPAHRGASVKDLAEMERERNGENAED
jgi:hypothetical protein